MPRLLLLQMKIVNRNNDDNNDNNSFGVVYRVCFLGLFVEFMCYYKVPRIVLACHLAMLWESLLDDLITFNL